jgi:hypothetical protein
MGVLVLRCPTTGREFSTGIFADEDTFKTLPNMVTKAACPHCGQLHRWRASEARLADSDELDRRSA